MTDDGGTLSGPGAGLGATGRTAADFTPGEDQAGTDYGDSSGIGTDVDREDAAGSAPAGEAGEAGEAAGDARDESSATGG